MTIGATQRQKAREVDSTRDARCGWRAEKKSVASGRPTMPTIAATQKKFWIAASSPLPVGPNKRAERGPESREAAPITIFAMSVIVTSRPKLDDREEVSTMVAIYELRKPRRLPRLGKSVL